jgi:biotin transport system substrate-specific component
MLQTNSLRIEDKRLAWAATPVLIISATILTAIAAQFRIPLPFSPVPITLQTFVVLLAGALIGWKRGAIAESLYLIWGVAGAPLFAGGALGLAILAGPTGGYLVGFILGAALVGWLVSHSKSVVTVWLSLLAGSAVILLCGWLQLSLFLAGSASAAFKAGVLPFIPGDLLKVTAATGIVMALRPVLRSNRE